MTRPVPDPIPLRPADRCRALLLPYGRPGLGLTARPGVLASSAIEAALADLGVHLRLSPPAWATLAAIVWCWHDQWDRAHESVQAHEGVPDADAVHLVLHRREGDAGNTRYWLAQVGYHPAWDRLVPVAAAEGLAGPLCDGPRFHAGAFLTRCLRPPAGEVAALERLQAAELLGILATVLRQ